MSTFEEIKKDYTEYHNEYAKRIKEISNRSHALESELSQDMNRMEELKKKYTDAMSSMDEKQADEIYEEIDQLRKGIGNKSQKLNILKSADPTQNVALKKIATSFVKNAATAIANMEQAALDRVKSIEAKRAEFFTELLILDQINDEIQYAEERIRAVAPYADKAETDDLFINPKLGVLKSTKRKVNIHDYLGDKHQYQEFKIKGRAK